MDAGPRPREVPDLPHLQGDLRVDGRLTIDARGTDGTRTRQRGLLIALFVVYLALLAWLVLWKLEVPWIGAGGLRVIKLTPFVSSSAPGASTLREVIANVVFFVPFGLYLGMLAPRWSWWKPVLVFAGTSLLFETLQYLLAIGSSDITDVITNTAGGIIGLLVAAVLRLTMPRSAMTVVTVACTVLTLIGVLATVLFVLSPLHYGPMDRAAPTGPAIPTSSTAI